MAHLLILMLEIGSSLVNGPNIPIFYVVLEEL